MRAETLFGNTWEAGPAHAAILSDDGRYRYWLSRRWVQHGPCATFVMLNPSTADATADDPTIRRCMAFARAWGLAGLRVVNLYALRATDPRQLWKVDTAQAVGPDNNACLLAAATEAEDTGSPLVAAWGANAKPGRVAEVLALPGMDRMQALGVTKDGHPRHPLYLPATAQLAPWGTS